MVLVLERHCFYDFLFVLPIECMGARLFFGPHPSLQKQLQRLDFQKNKETDKIIKAFRFIQHNGTINTNSSLITRWLLKQRH